MTLADRQVDGAGRARDEWDRGRHLAWMQILARNGVVTGVIDWTDVCLAPAELDVVVVRVGIETLPVPLGSVGARLVRARARRFFDAYTARSPLLDGEVLDYFEVLRCTRTLMSVAERRRALTTGESDQRPNPYDNSAAVVELSRRLAARTGCVVRLNSVGP